MDTRMLLIRTKPLFPVKIAVCSNIIVNYYKLLDICSNIKYNTFT